jgi:hypothetical protein
MEPQLIVAVALATSLAGCSLPGAGGAPSNACHLPGRGPGSPGAAASGPFSDVASGCEVYLGEGDNGRRLRVRVETTVTVDLPSWGYIPPLVADPDVLEEVAHSGNKLTVRAASPGQTIIYCTEPESMKLHTVNWEVAIEVTGSR